MEDTHSFLSVFNNMDAAELERLRDAYNAEHPSEPPIKGNIWKGFVLGLLTNKGLSLENGLSFLRENFSFIPSPIFVDI